MIRRIMTELEFPTEAIEYLAKKNAELSACESVKDELHEAYDYLFDYRDGEYMPVLNTVAQKSGIRVETVTMIFMLNAAITAKYIYRSRGFSDELWLENMRDLRYKLLEYKKYAGDWGTNVGYWFKKFYNLKRFKLGRLQFQLERSNVDYKNVVKVGDPVIYCHIPSSGPLNIEEVRDSFRKARVWFARELGDGAAPIFCDSWLLYPPMYKRLTEKSNIRKFAELFDVFETRESPENRNFWRVFYRDYSPEVLDEIEPKTSLERAVIELIRDGNTVGVGHGAVIVDGNF